VRECLVNGRRTVAAHYRSAGMAQPREGPFPRPASSMATQSPSCVGGLRRYGADLGATAASGITETARKEECINNEAREGDVSEESVRGAAAWQGVARAVSGTFGGSWMEAQEVLSLQSEAMCCSFRPSEMPEGNSGSYCEIRGGKSPWPNLTAITAK
jgi:hypothetical protein